MMWLFVFNWFQLVLAFVLGLAVARWVGARPRGHDREDLFAELAAERTKRLEAEADRARERGRAADIERKLQDLRREVRLGVHDEDKTLTPSPASVAGDAAVPATGGEQPPSTDGLAAVATAADAPSADPPSADARAALTAIDGVTEDLAGRLQAEGVTVADIAAWTDDDVARFEALLETAGDVAARDWVGQARALIKPARDTSTRRPAASKSARV